MTGIYPNITVITDTLDEFCAETLLRVEYDSVWYVTKIKIHRMGEGCKEEAYQELIVGVYAMMLYARPSKTSTDKEGEKRFTKDKDQRSEQERLKSTMPPLFGAKQA